MRGNVEACGTAATALAQLAQALSTAQSATRTALADCESAQATANRQQTAADQAGNDAQAADAAAASSAHPSVARAYADQANQARDAQSQAQAAANQAQTDLAAAQERGQRAEQEYLHDAQTAAASLRSAAGELRPTADLGHGWADPIVTWAGHANDFSGAGATGVIKGYDAAIALAAKSLVRETEDVLSDPTLSNLAVRGKAIPGYDGELDPEFDRAAAARTLADNPFTNFLTKGLPEDTFGPLSEVPYLAVALTGADVALNWKDEGPDALVAPVGNLIIGTTIVHFAAPAAADAALGATDLAATAATGLGMDGLATALAGSALIPGVGEAVAVGTVAVVGTILVDKGVTYVWDHGGEKVADEAANGIASGASWTYHEAKHVVHDLEPWNW
jgi:hypothetical protein